MGITWEAELQMHKETLWKCLPALASASRETRGSLLADVVFDGADVNKDQTLSHTELKKFLRSSGQIAKLVRPLNWRDLFARLDAYDENKNNMLEKDEWRSFVIAEVVEKDASADPPAPVAADASEQRSAAEEEAIVLKKQAGFCPRSQTRLLLRRAADCSLSVGNFLRTIHEPETRCGNPSLCGS